MKDLHGDIGTPYYVGKGKGRRLVGNHGIICVPKIKEHIVKIAENLVESEAFDIEKYLIKYYGRIDVGTGCLENRKTGGQGISKPKTEQHKQNMHTKFKPGNIPWNKNKKGLQSSPKKGKTHKEVFGEERAKEIADNLSKSHLGYTQTKESNLKRSNKLKDIPKSDDIKKKMSDNKKLYWEKWREQNNRQPITKSTRSKW